MFETAVIDCRNMLTRSAFQVFDVEDDVIDVVSVGNAVEPETKKASPVKKVSPVKSAKMSEKEKADEVS